MADENVGAKILRYPLDLTGTSQDNYISNEPHALAAGQNRVFVPSYGPFFTESMVVIDAASGHQLIKGTQYVAAQLISAATARAGKEVCGVVVITDPSVSANVIFTYQVIGGPYILSVQALSDMIGTLSLDNRPIYWGDALGTPNLFPAGHHLHDIGDIYGFEYLIYVLEDISNSILNGSQTAIDTLKTYIDHLLETHKASHDHDGLYYLKSQTYSQPEADALFLKKTDFSNAITIDGPLTVNQGATVSFHITNFDIYSTYDIQMVGCTAARYVWPGDAPNGLSAFAITVPANYPAGPSNFLITCNGSPRTIPLTVVATGVATPTISGNISSTEPTVTYHGTPFAVTSGADTSAQYEINVTNGSTGAVIFDQMYTFTSGATPSNAVTNLPLGTTVSMKLRYRGNISGWSNWSAPITFTTKATYVVVIDPNIATPTLTATPSTTDYTAVVVCSPFTMSAGSDTMVAYDWTISRQSGMLIDWSGGASNVAATSAPTFTISGPDMLPGRTYGVSIRYKGSNGEYSPWSNQATFKLKNAWINATGATVSTTNGGIPTPGSPFAGMVSAYPNPQTVSGHVIYQWQYVSGDTCFTANSPNAATTNWSSSIANATSVWRCQVGVQGENGVYQYYYTPNVTVTAGSGTPPVVTYQYPLIGATLTTSGNTNVTIPGSGVGFDVLSGSFVDSSLTATGRPNPTNASSVTYLWEIVSQKFVDSNGSTSTIVSGLVTVKSPTSAATLFTGKMFGKLGTVTGVFRCKITQGSTVYYTPNVTLTWTTFSIPGATGGSGG